MPFLLLLMTFTKQLVTALLLSLGYFLTALGHPKIIKKL